MNLKNLIILNGIIFGIYDIFIKLSAGKITPVLGAIICQTASAISAVTYLLYRYYISENISLKISRNGAIFAVIAGILITTALIFLYYILSSKFSKASTTLPSILIIRNITLVILGIFLLKEKVSLLKIFGIFISLFGVYLISL